MSSTDLIKYHKRLNIVGSGQEEVLARFLRVLGAAGAAPRRPVPHLAQNTSTRGQSQKQTMSEYVYKGSQVKCWAPVLCRAQEPTADRVALLARHRRDSVEKAWMYSRYTHAWMNSEVPSKETPLGQRRLYKFSSQTVRITVRLMRPNEHRTRAPANMKAVRRVVAGARDSVNLDEHDNKVSRSDAGHAAARSSVGCEGLMREGSEWPLGETTQRAKILTPPHAFAPTPARRRPRTGRDRGRADQARILCSDQGAGRGAPSLRRRQQADEKSMTH